MSFAWPVALAGLLVVPLAVWAYVAAQRRRVRYAVRFTNVDLLAGVLPARAAWRRHVPAAAALLALTCLVLAAARPHATVAVPRERATVMLVTDVSASMASRDVQPSRLGAAREAAQRFIDEVPDGLRVGLVAFDQAPQRLAAPTRDRGEVGGAIESLRTGPGTATGDGLADALEAIREDGAGGPGRPPGAIVLLSDGKTTAGRDPLGVAREARRRGVPISTVALGTDGGVIEIGGTVLPVPPDRVTMREVARLSGGRSFDAFDEDELRGVYERLGARLGSETEQREVTAGFAAGALLLLLAAGLLALRRAARLP